MSARASLLESISARHSREEHPRRLQIVFYCDSLVWGLRVEVKGDGLGHICIRSGRTLACRAGYCDACQRF